MKKIIAITLIISILVGMILVFIPRRELPPETDWQTYLQWEREFLQWRDAEASAMCIYQIQHRDTHEVYFWGSLQECKDNIRQYELT